MPQYKPRVYETERYRRIYVQHAPTARPAARRWQVYDVCAYKSRKTSKPTLCMVISHDIVRVLSKPACTKLVHTDSVYTIVMLSGPRYGREKRNVQARQLGMSLAWQHHPAIQIVQTAQGPLPFVWDEDDVNARL